MILWNLRIREKETNELVRDIYDDEPGAYGRILDGDYQLYDVSITAIAVN